MAVETTTKTERTIRCTLTTLVLCEETGTVRFEDVRATSNPDYVHEFADVLKDVAVMMENCGG